MLREISPLRDSPANSRMNETSRISRPKIGRVALFCCLMAFVVYIPALNNSFVNWDDPDYVYENPHIRTLDLPFFAWMFSSFHMQNWHPLTWFSHALDYTFWGLNPAGHHLTSIVLHALNTFLVVLLTSRLLRYRQAGSLSSTLHPPLVAAVTGLLFGLHPVHVESVAWISERKDLLFTFFYLLSILSYLNYVSSDIRRRKIAYYTFSLLAFAFSLMSKPLAVTLPVVLLILDAVPPGRLHFRDSLRSLSRILIEKVPFFIMSIAIVIVTVIAQQREIASFTSPLSERLLIALRAPGFYLFKTLWPADLVPLYPYSSAPSWLSLHSIAAVLAIALITVFCVLIWKKQKVFLAAWIFFLVTLSPVLGIIRVGQQAAADRYMYLPSIGPFFLAGLGVAWLWKQSRPVRKAWISPGRVVTLAALSGILICLMILTVRQTAVWRNSLSLWNRELEYYEIPVAYTGRGNAYAASGSFSQAIKDYTRAIHLEPASAKAYNNRALSYAKTGNYQAALDDLHTAITLNKNDARTYFNRGNVHKRLTMHQEAIEDYTEALRLDPARAEVYNNRGNTYMQVNEIQKAVEDFTRAVDLDPLFDKAFFNRGIAYERLGNHPQAVTDYQNAARLGNTQVQDYLNARGIGWE